MSKDKTFVGYHLITEQDKRVKTAEPEKALVDYPYFNLYDKNPFDTDELRLDKIFLKTMNVESFRFYAVSYNNKTSIALERISTQL